MKKQTLKIKEGATGGGGGERSSVKNNNERSVDGVRRRPLAALSGSVCAKSIPERGAGRRAEVGWCVGLCALVVWPLFS